MSRERALRKQALEREREALEQQTATAEILASISTAIEDTQPVFDAIVESSRRLLKTHYAVVSLIEDGQAMWKAMSGNKRITDRVKAAYPWSVNDERRLVSRAIRSGEVIQLCPLAGNPKAPEATRQIALDSGYDAILVAPLVRTGTVIGYIVTTRADAIPFDDKQVALIKSFAAQAVIAIENARLFNETKEALDRQRATGEILSSISSSVADTQPVFDAIVRSLCKLFGTRYAVLALLEGDRVELKALAGDEGFTARFKAAFPYPATDEDMIATKATKGGRVVQLSPIVGNPEAPPKSEELARLNEYNSIIVAPLMREERAMGYIVTVRAEATPFDEKQVQLIRSFADQAVIALENARLFKELQERTEALTKSVDQLTALGEVGQAISSTLDLDTVLKTIVSRAVQLTGLDAGAIYEYEEATEQFHLRAAENLSEEVLEALRSTPIRKGDGAVGGTAVAREPIQIPETQDESYRSRLRDLIIRTGRRALLAVPLMRENRIVGALTVQRNTPGPFAPEVVDLLKTFATQSALAIQNARLFREIEEKGKQLEIASRHKSHFLASMSHELRTPLNAILGFNEMILDGVYGELTADLKSPLENIQSSGKHLLRLINNVLDLAKIEAGRMELDLSDYSVQDTVASVHSTLKPLAAEKGLEFIVEVPPEIPLAWGDSGRLAQCLINLTGNSLKFTKQGRVAIAVARDDGVLRFSVADTGIGIPADKIPNLFTEFKQTDATIASEYGGTGLGLSITKKFIEMHGGRIWVESEPGKGSTFVFEIPLRAEQ